MDSNQCFFFLGPVKSNKAWSFGSKQKEQPKNEFQRWPGAKPYGKNKNVISRLVPLVLLVSLPLSQNLFAEGSSPPGYRTMDSHQHGLAELRLLLEEQRIEIEFESPAFNLVGFEHKASNPEEERLVRNVGAILASPAPLMSVKGGACSLDSSQVDVSSITGKGEKHGHEQADRHEIEAKHDHEDKHEHADEHEHEAEHDPGDKHEHAEEHEHEAEHNHEDKHEHADEHEHEAKHDHEDKHEHAHKSETSHADIFASYSFSCDNLGDLKYFQVNFFDIFSGLESVKGVWVSETSQGAAQLTDSNRRLYPK